MVLSAQVLPSHEFECTFQMTRNSFEQLHATLGTYSYYCSNLQSRTLRFRTHVTTYALYLELELELELDYLNGHVCT